MGHCSGDKRGQFAQGHASRVIRDTVFARRARLASRMGTRGEY